MTTTQALWQRRYREQRLAEDPDEYLAYRRDVRRRWQERNREKHNAHNKVYRAVRAGRLFRPDSCEQCGSSCTPEASHDDYSRPLDVEWLCRQCHARKDARPRGKD